MKRNPKAANSKKAAIKHIMRFIPVAALPLLAGIAIGYTIRPESKQPAPAAYAADPAYEYMVGSSAWQMSAEAHALMMQGFRVASENIEHMAALADAGQQGYYWEEENGRKKRRMDEQRLYWFYSKRSLHSTSRSCALRKSLCKKWSCAVLCDQSL